MHGSFLVQASGLCACGPRVDSGLMLMLLMLILMLLMPMLILMLLMLMLNAHANTTTAHANATNANANANATHAHANAKVDSGLGHSDGYYSFVGPSGRELQRSIRSLAMSSGLVVQASSLVREAPGSIPGSSFLRFISLGSHFWCRNLV